MHCIYLGNLFIQTNTLMFWETVVMQQPAGLSIIGLIPLAPISNLHSHWICLSEQILKLKDVGPFCLLSMSWEVRDATQVVNM